MSFIQVDCMSMAMAATLVTPPTTPQAYRHGSCNHRQPPTRPEQQLQHKASLGAGRGRCTVPVQTTNRDTCAPLTPENPSIRLYNGRAPLTPPPESNQVSAASPVAASKATTQIPQLPALLRLPSELRLEILSYVLLAGETVDLVHTSRHRVVCTGLGKACSNTTPPTTTTIDRHLRECRQRARRKPTRQSALSPGSTARTASPGTTEGTSLETVEPSFCDPYPGVVHDWGLPPGDAHRYYCIDPRRLPSRQPVTTPRSRLDLLRVCRQLHLEGRELFFSRNALRFAQTRDLAEFMMACPDRWPWIRDLTIVNVPLNGRSAEVFSRFADAQSRNCLSEPRFNRALELRRLSVRLAIPYLLNPIEGVAVADTDHQDDRQVLGSSYPGVAELLRLRGLETVRVAGREPYLNPRTSSNSNSSSSSRTRTSTRDRPGGQGSWGFGRLKDITPVDGLGQLICETLLQPYDQV